MTRILGYEVTTDPQALPTFIAQVAERYDQLEAAIVPLDTKIAELSQDWQPGEDWNPRPATYWQEVAELLSSLREASAKSLALFSKEPGTPAIPIVFSALSISFRCDLHSIVEHMDNAGMLLAAYRHFCVFCDVVHLEQRQHLLAALRRLAKQTHESVTRARAELDKAPEEQRKILRPHQPRLRVVGNES